MRKLTLFLMTLCLNVLGMQAQEKQVFTIDGYVDENITDSCYNIYIGDEYFRIDEDSKPIATVPVVNKRFTYSIPLDKMKAGRVRCIFPGGELCSAWIDLFFVPGETIKLTVHNGHFEWDLPYNYRMKVSRAVEAIRKETNWQSPHLPKVKGKVWKDVAYDKERCDYCSRYWGVKDVIFNDEETVVRIVYDQPFSNMKIGNKSYLQDEKGNKYKLKRVLMGLIDENNSPEIRIFGGYYAFEPLPKGTKSFSFWNDQEEGICSFPFPVMDIHKAERKKQKANFSMNVNVSQGIGDSGYLIFVYDKYFGGLRSQIDDIAVKDRKCSFSAYLDKPYLADLFATFPDGSICTHCVRFPFVPGEHVDVKVVNGGFYLTGSKFYKEWGDAEDLIENARKYHTPEETESIIKEYLKEHASEDGCALSFIQNHVLPCDTLEDMIPESIYDRMEYVADHLFRLIKNEERQNQVAK
jgi:hypothetical protein